MNWHRQSTDMMNWHWQNCTLLIRNENLFFERLLPLTLEPRNTKHFYLKRKKKKHLPQVFGTFFTKDSPFNLPHLTLLEPCLIEFTIYWFKTQSPCQNKPSSVKTTWSQFSLFSFPDSVYLRISNLQSLLSKEYPAKFYNRIPILWTPKTPSWPRPPPGRWVDLDRSDLLCLCVILSTHTSVSGPLLRRGQSKVRPPDTVSFLPVLESLLPRSGSPPRRVFRLQTTRTGLCLPLTGLRGLDGGDFWLSGSTLIGVLPDPHPSCLGRGPPSSSQRKRLTCPVRRSPVWK